MIKSNNDLEKELDPIHQKDDSEKQLESNHIDNNNRLKMYKNICMCVTTIYWVLVIFIACILAFTMLVGGSMLGLGVGDIWNRNIRMNIIKINETVTYVGNQEKIFLVIDDKREIEKYGIYCLSSMDDSIDYSMKSELYVTYTKNLLNDQKVVYGCKTGDFFDSYILYLTVQTIFYSWYSIMLLSVIGIPFTFIIQCFIMCVFS